MRCLHAAQLWDNPLLLDAGDRWVPRQLQVLPKVRRRSLRAVALCHVGRLIGRRRAHAC